MNYGYFDDKNREYVITNPNTPAPWANYLGSPEYGALISNNAGGYSFAQSGANGRILRYVFNQFDEPGRYLYIRDAETGDYWSASWQPVAKPLSIYKSECRHGMAYTILQSDYDEIATKATYYVPLDATHEVWRLDVTNRGNRARTLMVTGYAEFTNNSNYEQDQVNLQYSQFITRTEFHKNRIMQYIHGNLEDIESGRKVDHKIVEQRFFGLAGAPVTGYCGDKDSFIGRGRRYANPIGVEQGNLGDTLSYNENGCGALATTIRLEAGETKTIAYVLGMKYDREAERILEGYANPAATCDGELATLKEHWYSRFSGFQVETPSEAFDTMINTWNAYNCFMTFTWSRAASFIYCGLRNGYGYRDTVQDIQGIIHLDPEMAAEKIRFMLSAQVDNGGGLPLVKFTHNPGHEDTPDDASYVQETGHPAYRADDAMWLFPTVYKYIAETGNVAFLDEVIPYANKGEDTVYDHLKRAIDFSVNHLGVHGMPAGLYADWNDCLRLGKDGESTFVALQFYYAMNILREFAAHKKDDKYLTFLDYRQKNLAEVIEKYCWNEDRFLRGYTEDGEVIGHREDPEAALWLNPQSWSVISGYATPEQARLALDQVYEKLNTEYGVILMDPPYHAHAFEGALAVIYNAGVKENAGIFSQSQGWIILAEALMGHGNRAYTYFLENAPSAQNDRAEIRRLEPYCYGQFTEGKHSPHHGRSHVHWLTGTASTMMVGCVEGILGMRPSINGLKVAPAIPSEWENLTIEKTFRGKQLHIQIQNPDHKESGLTALFVNGDKLEGDFIPETLMTESTDILYVM